MSQLYKDIEALMVLDKLKEQIQNELITKYEQKRIEGALQYYPEALEFKKYKILNRILLGCIWIIAIINALSAFFLLGILGIIAAFIVPIMLVHYISRGKSGGYLAFMVLIVIGASKATNGIGETFARGDTLEISITTIYLTAILIGFILSFYLRKKLFPKSNPSEVLTLKQ